MQVPSEQSWGALNFYTMGCLLENSRLLGIVAFRSRDHALSAAWLSRQISMCLPFKGSSITQASALTIAYTSAGKTFESQERSPLFIFVRMVDSCFRMLFCLWAIGVENLNVSRYAKVQLWPYHINDDHVTISWQEYFDDLKVSMIFNSTMDFVIYEGSIYTF